MARELREFLDLLERRYPDQIVRVHKEVDPASFDVTAILQHLENRDRYPLVLFERPRNLKGEVARFPLVSNVYATRERCAIALGLEPSQAMLGLSLEYARREERSLDPVTMTADEAPVKQWVRRGDDVDLGDL